MAQLLTVGDLTFQPWDTNNPVETTELDRQRRLCGWGWVDIPHWADMLAKEERYLWWIFAKDAVTPDNSQEKQSFVHPDMSNFKLPPHNPAFAPIGHIALDVIDHEGDLTLADKAKNTMSLATFFILPSQGNKGYGRAAMRAIEKVAHDQYNCKTMTLNTLPNTQAVDPEYWKKIGIEFNPNLRPLTEAMYVRWGYEKYREDIRYKIPDGKGGIVHMPAAYLRKTLT